MAAALLIHCDIPSLCRLLDPEVSHFQVRSRDVVPALVVAALRRYLKGRGCLALQPELEQMLQSTPGICPLYKSPLPPLRKGELGFLLPDRVRDKLRRNDMKGAQPCAPTFRIILPLQKRAYVLLWPHNIGTGRDNQKCVASLAILDKRVYNIT